MASYVYTNSDFTNATNVNLDALTTLIQSEVTSATLIHIDSEFKQNEIVSVTIHFSGSLSSPDKTTLDGIISSYTYHTYSDTIAHIKDIKSIGTNGGIFTSGSWQTRVLNTLEGDINFVSLNNNQMTIEPGTYIINIKAPACNVRNHQCRLYNVTDSTYIIGSNAFAYNDSITTSELTATLNLNDTKVFEVQHICSDTADHIGYGKSTGFSSTEVYTIVTLQKN